MPDSKDDKQKRTIMEQIIEALRSKPQAPKDQVLNSGTRSQLNQLDADQAQEAQRAQQLRDEEERKRKKPSLLSPESQ